MARHAAISENGDKFRERRSEPANRSLEIGAREKRGARRAGWLKSLPRRLIAPHGGGSRDIRNAGSAFVALASDVLSES
jgi:hypothetical protein